LKKNVVGAGVPNRIFVVEAKNLSEADPLNSLLQMLSQYGNILQTQMFPVLQEGTGELDEGHQKFVRILTLLYLDRFTEVQNGPGRPPASRANIARAFVAKAVFGIPQTKGLRERLVNDAVLRSLCGWQHADEVPEEWTFSRAFQEFSESELPQRVHAALIERAYQDRLVGHISRDATAIEAREKTQPKPSTPAKRPSRKKNREAEEMTRIERQSLPGTTLAAMLQELPRACDKGSKTNSKGSKDCWVGYKLHMDVADGQVPISCLLTSASVHDSQAAIPLACMTADRVTSLYDLMDRGYESKHIEAYSRGLGHVPIIDCQKRGGQEKPVMAPHQQVRFRERTTVERVYARLKDEFGGRFVRVRGHAKVMAHLMFGVLVLTVDQLLKVCQAPPTPA
jgi:hypothetical protein